MKKPAFVLICILILTLSVAAIPTGYQPKYPPAKKWQTTRIQGAFGPITDIQLNVGPADYTVFPPRATVASGSALQLTVNTPPGFSGAKAISLQQGPPGMVFQPRTTTPSYTDGVLIWEPTPNQVGDHEVLLFAEPSSTFQKSAVTKIIVRVTPGRSEYTPGRSEYTPTPQTPLQESIEKQQEYLVKQKESIIQPFQPAGGPALRTDCKVCQMGTCTLGFGRRQQPGIQVYENGLPTCRGLIMNIGGVSVSDLPQCVLRNQAWCAPEPAQAPTPTPAPQPACSPSMDQSCNRNQCGGTGIVQCDGRCSAPAPNVPQNLGQACGCGGTIQCDGSCSKAACPAGQQCQNGQCVQPPPLPAPCTGSCFLAPCQGSTNAILATNGAVNFACQSRQDAPACVFTEGKFCKP